MPESPEAAVDLGEVTIGVDPRGNAQVIENSAGPPRRIDGYSIGAPLLTREPPHSGEMHPDGDEILYLVSGKITVVLEDQDPPREVSLHPGEAVVVPRGVWHRVVLSEPSRLVHVTPGPRGEHRPLPESSAT